MMPLVVITVAELGDIGDVYELSENAEKEEQRDKRESGEKEGKDGVEEFVLHKQLNLATLRDKKSDYFSNSKEFVGIAIDVLTPPPEFI